MELDFELVQDFLDEAREQCARAEAILLGLRDGVIARDQLDELFRFAHTVKGSGMAVGVAYLPDFMHRWEDVLSSTRERPDPVVLSPDTVSLFLECNDAIRQFVAAFPGDTSATMRRFAGLNVRLLDARQVDKLAGRVSTVAPAVIPSMADQASDTRSPDRADTRADLAKGPTRSGKKAPTPGGEDAVRVKLSRIDALIRKIGELSAQQERVTGRASDDTSHPELDLVARKVARLCGEAHDIAMSLRMVPIRPIVQTLRRTCRDTALKLGKEVDFVAEGESAELDINLVKGLGEALVHLIRNAVDHGIEAPHERQKAGKPARGTVALAVSQQGGNIEVVVRDDGRGLNANKIRRKAIDRGWLTEDANLSPTELFEFVFRPGFSTNEIVTEFSGRGVGLDVVSSNIKAIDGSVSLRSEPQVGTTFTIFMPLSLALVDVMRVKIGGYTFLVPLHAIRETVAVEPSSVRTVAAGAQMITLRGTALPIYDLHGLLVREPIRVADTGTLRLTALIAAKQGQAFAFAVDDVVGRQRVVVKPLGQELADLDGISGSAVLGDGSVGLLVDLFNVITSRGLSRE